MAVWARVLTAAGDELTDSDDEFRVDMRQIMGVFSQREKTRLVKKLKAARLMMRNVAAAAGRDRVRYGWPTRLRVLRARVKVLNHSPGISNLQRQPSRASSYSTAPPSS